MTDSRTPRLNRPPPTPSIEEYRASLKWDLRTFTERSFAELNPSTDLNWNWHIDAIVDKLEACRRGEIRKLIINVPPRSLKSHCASIALPAFILGHDPSAQIICASYAQPLADKLARDTRSVMMSSWYQRSFGTRLLGSRPSVQELETKSGGIRYATSVGGGLTGRGADFIIIDDALKPDEAASDVQRRRVNEWYDSTLSSRLNDKQRGCEIVIMQRLNEDDLVGHLLEQGGWELLSFPAIAERDERFEIKTMFGSYVHQRKVGDVLHPEREPREVLDRLKLTLGAYNFAGQYQQSPRPLGGGLVKEAWFATYTPSTLPVKFERVIQSWDTANKATELADYSVCTTWGEMPDETYYLLDVLREKLEYPELKRMVRNLHGRWRPQTVLIEDKASGIQLIQELRREGLHAVTPYRPQSEKVSRLLAQTPTIEQRRVHLPEQASWRAAYVHELTSFPNGRHDDQVDSTAQALEWLTSTSGPARWLRMMDEVIRRRAAEGR